MSSRDVVHVPEAAHRLRPAGAPRTWAYLKRARGWLLAAACLGMAGTAGASEAAFPVRPVRIVVGFSPGGGPDVVGRLVADALSARFGHPVVVDNRPGANGVIGADIVSKATPDGHTVLVTSASFAINPSIYRKLPYDPVKGFAPVTNIALGGGLILCVSASFPAKTVQELIELARKPGARLSYGSAGIGNTTHLTAALFNVRAGTQMTHVPYKGAGQAIAALLASEVQVLFTTPASSMSFIKAGKLRPLAYNHGKRLDVLPDVPTLREAGVPDTEFAGSWYGVFAPPATPPALVTRLQQEIAYVATQPAFKTRLAGMGLEPDGRPPQEFAAFVERAIAQFREVVKIAGIEPQ